MTKVLFITQYIQFTSSWGVLLTPDSYLDGWVVPLGWENEFKSRNIDYILIDYIEDNNLPIDENV